MMPFGGRRAAPLADGGWVSQYVLPSAMVSQIPGGGVYRPHPAHEGPAMRTIHEAALRSGIAKRATSHAFRHSLATRRIEGGYNMPTVPELPGMPTWKR